MNQTYEGLREILGEVVLISRNGKVEILKTEEIIATLKTREELK